MEKHAVRDLPAGLRVALIRNAYAHDFGGAERYVVLLAQELEKNGLKPTVISRQQGVLSMGRRSGIKTIKGWWWSHQNWGGGWILATPVYVLWQLVLTAWYLQLFIRLRPHVVHIQSRDDFIAASLAGRLLGKRVVWTDHADLKYIFMNHQSWYKNPVGKLVFLASKLAHVIVIVSHGEWRLIEHALGHQLDSRFQHVYNGVPDEAAPAMKRSPALTQAVIFCCTSRLVTSKGIAELIQAFKLVQQTHPSVHLWLVGDGPEAARFRSLAGKDLAIEFIGHSDNALAYVAACDIFVHPSYNEAFSLSILEAAQAGKPIIACDVGGNAEIVADSINGRLVSPHQVEPLAAAMIELAADTKLRQHYGRASRQRYEDSFVFANIVKEGLLKLYV